MKKINSFVSLMLVFVLLFAFAIPGAAANETTSINITNRAIKIAVDGIQIIPTDAGGNAVEPFIYEGTTYLPVRAVAGALGLLVGWDAETSTVTLTTGAEKTTGSGTPAATNETKSISITYRDIKIAIDGVPITPTDAGGDTVEAFIYDGTTYLPVRAIATALGVEVGWDAETSTVYLGERPVKTYWLLETETSTDLNGNVSYVDTYRYDQYGRCTEIATHFPDDPSSDYTETRSYDADGKMIFQDFGDEYSRYTYDEDGNVISDKYYYDGNMTEYQYIYHEAGRQSKVIMVEDGATVATCYCTYDSRGDLVKFVTEYMSFTTEETMHYEYDESDRCVSENYNYSDGDYEYGKFFMYTYDAQGRISVEHQYWVDAGEKTYADTGLYTYDDNGKLTKLAYDNTTLTYTYIPFEV